MFENILEYLAHTIGTFIYLNFLVVLICKTRLPNCDIWILNFLWSTNGSAYNFACYNHQWTHTFFVIHYLSTKDQAIFINHSTRSFMTGSLSASFPFKLHSTKSILIGFKWSKLKSLSLLPRNVLLLPELSICFNEADLVTLRVFLKW